MTNADPSRHYTLADLEAHAPQPCVDRAQPGKGWMELMAMKPAPLVVNPPAIDHQPSDAQRPIPWLVAITPPDPKAIARARLAQLDAEAAALRAQLS